MVISSGVMHLLDSNVIDKFPFATDTNATDVGDLSGQEESSGQSSTTMVIVQEEITLGTNTIEKFPFAADTNATDVGDLT
jgi:hypothetical protein